MIQVDGRAGAEDSESYTTDIIKLRDGQAIYFRTWKPQSYSNRAVILFHRGHEHSGRLIDVVKELNIQDAWVFAWDARGHGQSAGRIDSFERLVDDIDEFVTSISERFAIPIKNMSIVAHSFAAVAAASWVQRKASQISSLILLAPAFYINLFVPFAYDLLKVLKQVRPSAKLRSYVSGRMLTRCPEAAAQYDKDLSITKTISAALLLELRDAAVRLLADSSRILVPTLLLIPGDDFVVQKSQQEKFFEELKSDRKRLKVYQGMRHDIFHEVARDEPLSEIRSYVLENFELPNFHNS